jgi:hemoglobin/transferrin/lactoferrin receptor protein
MSAAKKRTQTDSRPPGTGAQLVNSFLVVMGLLTVFAPSAIATNDARAAADPEGDTPGDTEIALDLDPVLVTVGRVAQPARQVLTPVSVVDRDEIELRQAGDLSDLLFAIPGVSSTQGPRPEAMVPNIRGLGEGRVVMRIDGARQNMAIRHRAHTLLDPALLQRVEVLRGPASTLYGSGATGGVILFETRDADDVLAPGRRLGGRASLGFHGNNDEAIGTATLAGQAGDFGLLTSVSRRSAEDYSDGSDNTLSFTEFDVLSGLVKSDWDIDADQELELTWLGFVDESPSLTTADRPVGDVVDRSTRQQSASLRYRLDPDDQRVSLDAVLYWSDLIFDEQPVTADQARDERSLDTVGLDVSNTSRFTAAGVAHTLTYGFEAYRDEQQGLSDAVPAPEFRGSERDTLGLFVQNRAELSRKLDLILGVRYDDIESVPLAGNLDSTSFSETSWQAGVLFELTSDWQLSASLNEAFRAPALRELFIGGRHFPGNTYIPNPELRPESARSWELGLRYSRSGVLTDGDRVRGRLSWFRNDIEDFIEQRVRGANAPPPLTDTTRFDNVGEARIVGVELELEWRLAAWRARLFGARLRGDDRELGVPLESIPADEIGLRLERSVRSMLFGGQAVYVAEQDRLFVTPFGAQPTPSHTRIDLFARWQATAAFVVSARIDNLTDATYRRHLTLINQPGRSVKLEAAYRF